MGRTRVLSPLPLFDEPSVLKALRDNDIKEMHAYTMWRYLLNNEGSTVQDVPKLPKKMYELFGKDSNFVMMTSTLKSHQKSVDGTIKFIIELQDHQFVEAVIIPHDAKTSRRTLCVSSQVGCQMGCTFCATGTIGLKGNLHMGEILEQLMYANKYEKISNIVFMGMGEPLHNYSAVVGAILAMSDNRRFNLAQSRITLSTVGIVNKLIQLTDEAPMVSVALSLHAPTQELRQQIVPAAKVYKLEKLMEAVDYYLNSKANRRILVEYVMLAGVNDSIATAHDLGKLVGDRNMHVNLIPYNPTDVPITYHPPSEEQTQAFYRVLIDEYKIFTTVRQHHGRDIDGACGQLALKVGQQRGGDSCRDGQIGDIEDMMSIGAMKKPKRIPNNKRKPAKNKLGIDSGVSAGMSEGVGGYSSKAQGAEPTTTPINIQTNTHAGEEDADADLSKPDRADYGVYVDYLLLFLSCFFLLAAAAYALARNMIPGVEFPWEWASGVDAYVPSAGLAAVFSFNT